jgi:DNA-binding transcriptional MerR regulator
MAIDRQMAENALLPAAGVDKKSLSAFRTIGETAEIVGVAQHVLRFWETKIKQITPLKRRGRRYYGPEDIAILKQIKTLLYTEGYTVKGVQNSLNNILVNNITVAAPSPAPTQHDLFSFTELASPHPLPPFTEEQYTTLHEILSTLTSAQQHLAAALAL